MAYIQISITTNNITAEILAELFHELEALSITLEDAQDKAIFQTQPDEAPLWEKVLVKALFPDTISPRLIMNDLKKSYPSREPLNYRIEKIADQDWVRLTQQNFKSHCYGNNLWICPSWDNAARVGHIVFIDPGLAFGTGTHPTTNLCLTWLAQHDIQDKIVIDYGCGSGILALAAVILGAKHVYAVDHDEQALIATRNNAQANKGIGDKLLTVCYPEELPTLKADIMLANILANPIMQLEPSFANMLKPQGQLVLSGILEHEAPHVVRAYQKDFSISSLDVLEEWVRIEALLL